MNRDQTNVRLCVPFTWKSHQHALRRSCNTFIFSGIMSLLFSSVMHASESNAATNLPPLSEAHAAGLKHSSYLQTSKSTKANVDNSTADLNGFKQYVAPTFKSTCIQCHGPDKQKGDFRVDTLNPNLLTGGDVNKWLEIFDVISNGEMPPPDKKDVHLSDQQRNQVIEWVGNEIQKASLARRDEGGHSSFRRMARYEYNYALQDILNLPYEFSDLLPPETVSEDGFKNSSHLLQMTSMQFENYREIGLTALKKAIVQGNQPPLVTYCLSMEDYIKSTKDADKKGKGGLRILDTKSGKSFTLRGDYSPKMKKADTLEAVKVPSTSSIALVFQRGQKIQFNLQNHLPDSGIMRIRLRSGRTNLRPEEYASFRITFGAHTSNNANFSQVVSKRDLPVTAPADKPEFVVFDIPLSEIPRNPFRNRTGDGPGRTDELLTIELISNAGNKKGEEPLAVCVDYLDIISPVYDEWPPKSHADIFIASRNAKNEKAYSAEVLANFMERAWRRPVSSSEVAPFSALFSNYRRSLDTFEDAMIETLATVLASPEFIYITQKDGASNAKNNKIDDYELASRLSIFLWSSIPDDELIKLAKTRKLSDPKTLTAQVNRMLADPRAERLSYQFVQQWLGLDALESITVDEKLFGRTFDNSLQQAIAEEPIAFFTEVLKQNNSIMDFIHSDYAVVNERLANHYGIPKVYGPEFRKVTVDEKNNRGGILTNAAILTMNANGIDSNPLKRGVWLMKHILNDPPPPPPPNVPQVDLTDPEILKMTLKEQIVNHRQKPACYSCHAKIDPWGIAFENYDAIGSWRTTDVKNKPVDATAELFNKQPLAGIDGLKRYLLFDRQDQFARAMVHKMTSYALGRPISFSDRADIETITSQFRKNGDKLRDLVTLIITSDLFHAK